MQSVVSGCFVGLEETRIRLRLRTGEVKAYPRKELDISPQWVLKNMGQPVICLMEDGVVRKMKPLGQQSKPGEADVA